MHLYAPNECLSVRAVRGSAGEATSCDESGEAAFCDESEVVVASGEAAFSLFAEKTAKAVYEDNRQTLRFVYDYLDYGTKDTHWFSVAEAEAINPYSEHVPWYGKRSTVTKVVFDSSFADYRPTQCGHWFYCFESLSAIEGIGNLDTSAATSLANMFCGCPSLTSLDVTGFDTANVTSMYGMFSRTSLTSLDLSGFDTSKVTDMGYMLYNCSSLETIFTSDAFVTTAVTDSSNMFTLSTKLVGGAGTGYDSTKKDKTYARIDGGPSAPGYFTRRDRIAKAVVADGGKTLRFVYDSKNYGEKDTDWFSVAEAEMINPDNEDVPWYGKMWSKVTKVVFAESFAAYQPTSVANWFFNFTMLTAVEGVAYWDTSKTTTFYALFAKCSGLTTLDLAGLSTASAKNVGSMFNGCTALTTITATDSFAVPEAARSNNMFKNCTALVGGNGTQFDGDKTSGEYARIDKEGLPGYFTGPVAKVVVEDGGATLRFVYDNLDYGEKDTAWFSVAEAEAIDPYKDNEPWYDCGETVTKVVFDPSFAAYRPKQCGSWFFGFRRLSHIDYIENLNTSEAKSFVYMFSHCCALKSLNVSGFNTANVTDMGCMFDDCSSLTTLDVSGFDTANVTDMDSMFSGCSLLTSLDLTGFDTANVTDMDYMFYGCSSLEAICVSGRFVTDQVSDSDSMFENCSKLKGGAGTAYDSDKIDKAYARIDGEGGQPGYFTRAAIAGGYAAWAAEQGLAGDDAAWDAKPSKWGGEWENAFIYTYGEGLAGGTLAIMNISFDVNGKPVITTTPVVEGHTDFTPAVIGTPTLDNWTSPVVLENKSGNDWTLPVGASANFFRVRLSE